MRERKMGMGSKNEASQELVILFLFYILNHLFGNEEGRKTERGEEAERV